MKKSLMLASLAMVCLPCAAEMSAEVETYLNPSRGMEIGRVYEAFLSPHQESGEEEDTPESTPETFKSTEPSRSRDEREADGHRAHGLLRFTKDLSRAYVDIKFEANNLTASDEIVMFHLHCGRPGILGPILVDFALVTDIPGSIMDDGLFSVELTNSDIVATSSDGDDIVAAFTRGCLIPSPSENGLIPVKTSTIGGMATIAEEGELYFNLHTKGQTYYGDMRGQLLPLGTGSRHQPQ